MKKVERITIPVSDEQAKQAAMHALEYSINGILLQMQLKYNVRITGIRLEENHDLHGVCIDWQETASGIRSDAEVQQLLNEQCSRQLSRITEKLANNG